MTMGEVKTELEVLIAVAAVMRLTSEQRRAALLELADQMCMHCGDDNPDCVCWNDE
jgi:hypothetical protein